VLFETKTVDGLLEGLTDNYVRVRVQGDNELLGGIAAVCIEAADAEGAFGVLT
jgi:hypothetical protein